MDKNKTDWDEIIIEKSPKIGKYRRVSEGGVAAFGWLVWFAMIRPLLLLTIWCFGIRVFYEEMIELGGFNNLRVFGVYFLVILGIYTILQLWNRYNVLRFRGKDRRQGGLPASNYKMGAFFQMPEEKVETLKKENAIDVHFLPDQSIVFELTGAYHASGVSAVYDPQKGWP